MISQVVRLGWMLWFTVAMAGGQTRDEAKTTARVREIFLAVERVERLPESEQAPRLPRLYREYCPELEVRYRGALAMMPPREEDSESGGMVERANQLEKLGGWPLLAEAARRRCEELFRRHPGRTLALVESDLASGSPEVIRRGLSVAGRLRFTELYDKVVETFHGPEADTAAYTLRDLDDPRAIRLLLDRHTGDPMRYFEVLRVLQRKRPPEARLLALVASESADVRWRAAYALAESGDPSLGAVVRKLAADSAPEVRRQAVAMGFSLPGAVFGKLRPALVSLLSDSDRDVRLDAARYFAERKDIACARTLLELMRMEESLELWQQSNVVQAIHTLTGGDYFGFMPGTLSTPEVRRAGLERFARWIEESGRP